MPTVNIDSLLTGTHNSSIEGSHVGNQSHLSNANNATVFQTIYNPKNVYLGLPLGPNSPIGTYASLSTPEAREMEGGIKNSPEQLSGPFQEKKSPTDNFSESLQSPTTMITPSQLKQAQERFEMKYANLILVMDHRYVYLPYAEPIDVMLQRYTLPLNQSPQRPEPDSATARGSVFTLFRGSQQHQAFTITLEVINKKQAYFPSETPLAIESYMRGIKLGIEEKCIALWEPLGSINSRLSRQLQQANICLGDIGHFNSSGGFETKFNILLSKEENVLLGHCPPVNFVPWEDCPSFLTGRRQPGPCYFRTGNIFPQSVDKNGDSWKFAYGEKKGFGAALVLPDGYCKSSLQNIINKKAFLQHLEAEIQRYFQYIKATYRKKPPLETRLSLVTSVYYSKTWANIIYSSKRNGSREEGFVAELNRSVPGLDIWRWKHSSPSDILPSQSGPSESELDNGVAVTNNQCIGVEVAQIKPNRTLLRNVSASLSSIAR